MKHKLLVQNSEDWIRARLGKPTASKFDKIITLAGNKTGAPWYDYMYQLVYERIAQCPPSPISSPSYWMQRGSALEPEARRALEGILGRKLFRVGLVTTDDGKIGASPDCIVNWSWGVEIKCPSPWQHIQYSVRGPEKDYKAQIQGQMYVGEFDRMSFFSYNPGMPCCVHDVKRDEEYIKKMHKLLREFCAELDETEKQARALGDYYPAGVLFDGQTWKEAFDPDYSMDTGIDRESA